MTPVSIITDRYMLFLCCPRTALGYTHARTCHSHSFQSPPHPSFKARHLQPISAHIATLQPSRPQSAVAQAK